MHQLWPMLTHIATAALPLVCLSIVHLNTREPMGLSFAITSSPVYLPTVTQLSLRYLCRGDESKILLDNLKVPALQSLEWDHSVCWDDDSMADNLISFIQQSGHTLRSLFILHGSRDRMRGILAAAPTLQNISVQLFGDPTWFLDIISQKDFMSETLPFLPILERLHITIRNPRKMEWPSLPGIFIEDPSSIYDSVEHLLKVPTIPVPRRERLRISIHRSWVHGMDYTLLRPAFNFHSLVALVELWRQHGIFCVLQDLNGSVPSDIHISSFIALHHELNADSEYRNSIYHALETISTLRFRPTSRV